MTRRAASLMRPAQAWWAAILAGKVASRVFSLNVAELCQARSWIIFRPFKYTSTPGRFPFQFRSIAATD